MFSVRVSHFERSNKRRCPRLREGDGLRGSDGFRGSEASRCEWPKNEERQKQKELMNNSWKFMFEKQEKATLIEGRLSGMS